MMRPLAVFVFGMLIVLTSYSITSSKPTKVLGKFVLNQDGMQRLNELLKLDELNVYEFCGYNDHIKRIIVNDHIYMGKRCKIVLLLVNDVLYGVQYYPSDKDYYRYVKRLNRCFSRTTSYVVDRKEVEWFNDDVIVRKGLTGKYEDYFVHYSKRMLKRYPDYKDF